MRGRLERQNGRDMDRPERQREFSRSYGNEWCCQKGDKETDCSPQQACTEAYQSKTDTDDGEVNQMQGSEDMGLDTYLSHLERAK